LEARLRFFFRRLTFSQPDTLSLRSAVTRSWPVPQRIVSIAPSRAEMTSRADDPEAAPPRGARLHARRDGAGAVGHPDGAAAVVAERHGDGEVGQTVAIDVAHVRPRPVDRPLRARRVGREPAPEVRRPRATRLKDQAGWT
jgi:hypothetical protein